MIKSWYHFVLGYQQVGDLWQCHVGSTCFLCSPLVFDIISFHKSYTLWTWLYHVSLWMKCINHHDNLLSSTQGVLIYQSILWVLENINAKYVVNIYFLNTCMKYQHSCANLLDVFFFVYILFCWSIIIFNGKPKNTKVVKDSIVIDKRQNACHNK